MTRGGLTEALWETSSASRLADVGDPPGFIAQIRRLLDDPLERRRASQNGRALYESNFDIGRSVAALRTAS
jgi:hypothetical protein